MGSALYPGILLKIHFLCIEVRLFFVPVTITNRDFIFLISVCLNEISNTNCFGAIKLSPYHLTNDFDDELALFVGAIVRNRSQYSFTMGNNANSSIYQQHQNRFLNQAIDLPVPVNSFCFSSPSSNGTFGT